MIRSRRTGLFTAAAVGTVAVLLSISTTVQADIRPPAKKPTVTITAHEEIARPQLLIPRHLIAEAAPKVSNDSSRTPTIISGIALSAGIALCGLVLLRRRRFAGGVLAACLAVGTTLAGYGGYLLANAPPPPPALPETIMTPRELDIIIVDGGTNVELRLQRDTSLAYPVKPAKR